MKDWINDESNRKSDGTKYNLNSDGLKIYTTINYTMQEFAENAVANHMPRLQKEFFLQSKNINKNSYPFRNLRKNEIENLINSSIRRSERWSKMKYDLGKNDKEIIESFYEPVEMTVFSWQGEIDTIMKPIDSLKYYK